MVLCLQALQRKFVKVVEEQHQQPAHKSLSKRGTGNNRGFAESFYVPSTAPAPMSSNPTPKSSAKADRGDKGSARGASPKKQSRPASPTPSGGKKQQGSNSSKRK